jgi:hypothetical protein
VDTVMARLAFYGVGNLVGSINVLSLESSKFLRAPKPVTPTASQTDLNSTRSGHETTKPGDIEADGGGDLSPIDAAAAAASAAEQEQTQRKKTLIGEVASQIRVEQVVEAIEVS